MGFNLIISSCRLLSVNLTIEGDDVGCRSDKWWFYPLGLYPLSYFLSFACHSYILGVVVACFGMDGHGHFF